MSSKYRYIAAFAAAIVALVAGITLIEKMTIDQLLRKDATSTGIAWANYLVANIKDIDKISAGAEPSAESRAFFEQARNVGQVFASKIYDPAGHVRMIADSLPEEEDDEETLSDHNEEAEEALAEGKPAVEAKEGKPPERPPFYSEAYVPAYKDGRLIGVVEAYVDQTEKRALYHQSFGRAAVALSLLICLAFGIPAAAWYRRSREQQRAEDRAQYLAQHDALTGLINRGELTAALDDILATIVPKGLALAVHIVDLDHFKDINDTLGHDAGDALLKGAAERLAGVTQSGDLLARLGGDEFAIVQAVPPSQGPAAAARLGANIIEALSRPFAVNGHEVKVSSSVGAALAPEQGADANHLLKCADLALYRSKADGRSRFRLFSSDLAAELGTRVTLEKLIRDALNDDKLELHFQPLFKISGPLIGFEALLRLRASDGSHVPPTTFIPLAETMGLIDRISVWVLRRACLTARAWPDALTVAVNLSPAQFAAGNVCQTVADILQETGLAPHRLELEITESLLLRDSEKVLAELSELKGLGVSIVMDDFGTGYSSLSYLWRFPFDKIKIDRSFMPASSQGDGTAQKIIRTIASLGHSLNMTVTMEGVETTAQHTFISDTACDQVQGFYYGRPAPESEIAQIILADFRDHLADRSQPAAPASDRWAG